MSTYSVGDTVRVKTGNIDAPAGICFAPDMRTYCGIHATIVAAYVNTDGKSRYRIAEDHKCWVWCDEFFEPVDTAKEPYEYW